MLRALLAGHPCASRGIGAPGEGNLQSEFQTSWGPIRHQGACDTVREVFVEIEEACLPLKEFHNCTVFWWIDEVCVGLRVLGNMSRAWILEKIRPATRTKSWKTVLLKC